MAALLEQHADFFSPELNAEAFTTRTVLTFGLSAVSRDVGVVRSALLRPNNRDTILLRECNISQTLSVATP